MGNNTNRRNFIKKATLGGLMAVSIPEIISASAMQSGIKKIPLKRDNLILFQGDSITDSGRNREDNSFNNVHALGSGYAMLAGAKILNKYAELNLKVFNRGVSGNKVYQLAERWDTDCLALKPDILSILIGVNDFWHKLEGQYNGTLDIFRNDYITLLERTKKALPKVKLIICEPFAVMGVKDVNGSWYPEYYAYQEAVRVIADHFGASFIPFQKIFDVAQAIAPGDYWTVDGVHPTLAGAQMMAQAWVEAVK